MESREEVAVIFDLGGVVLNSPFPAIAEYEALHGLPENAVHAIIGKSGEQGAFARLERGELSVEEFPSEFAADCELLGLPKRVDGGEIIQLILQSCTPRPLWVEALGLLRSSQVKTAALTNNFRSSAGDDRFSTSMAEIRNLFDVCVESASEGLRKPEPAIYELACSRLDVPPAACIFLDDIGRNLKPAKAMGMRTIRVEPSDATGRHALKALAAMLGGAAGRRLQQSLRLARL